MGPLRGQESSDSTTMTGIATEVGETVSIGVFIPIKKELSTQLVIDGVMLLNATPGLKLDAALASTGNGIGS